MPAGRDMSETGESEYFASPRGPASSASTELANSILESSLDLYGSTLAPRAVAMTTAVENDMTSTMMTASLIGASEETPFSPHSHRISNSA